MCKRVSVGRMALSCALALFLAFAACGCELVDQFGTRATNYNFQTSDAKSTNILLNVVRAAYSEPLQFTDVTTVAGQNAIQASAASVLPSGLGGGAAATSSISPGIQASGNTTFNVANLNTQEFYYGLQTPVSMDQIALYLSGVFNGLNMYLLLPLFVSEIDISYSDGTTKSLRNRGNDPDAYRAFYSAANLLVRSGLSVEPVPKKKATNVGPRLSESEAKDPKLLAALIAAGRPSGSGKDSGNDPDSGELTLKTQTKEVGSKTITTGFQLQKSGDAGKSGASYRFCFARPMSRLYLRADFWVRARPRGDGMTIKWAIADGKPVTARIGKEYFCGAKADNSDDDSPRNSPYQGITLKTRSLEEIFYFLGEMVRIELGLEGGAADSLAVKLEDGSDFFLFRVEARPPRTGEPWITFNGKIYSVRVDPSGQTDASSRVLQVLTDLLALQSSAKSLPAPNLIAITAP
jgi:hypothetical protein